MTRAIIAIPATLARHQLIALQGLLSGSHPHLRFEFHPDRDLKSPDVRAFVDDEPEASGRREERFSRLSSLQSALHKYDSLTNCPRPNGL
jgi:hypothetical protein